MLQDIIAELMRSHEDKTAIPLSTARMWMSSTESAVKGATYSLLADAKECGRIKPPLDFDEEFNWMLQYWGYCFRSNPNGEWVHSRWDAGSEVLHWFTWLWEEAEDRKYCERLTIFLEELYLTGTRDLKDCIEVRIVEHLFEIKGIREFFKDWKGHPKLGKAYKVGMEWVNGGGKTLKMVHQFSQIPVPQLSFGEKFTENLRWFTNCLMDDPRPKWIDMRDTALWDMPRWFLRLWNEGKDRKYFEQIREILEELYPTGSRKLKNCIERAVLGPMFEKEPIREVFAAWKDNPKLRPAYEAALRWVHRQSSSKFGE
jgi:hypothetical protein